MMIAVVFFTIISILRYAEAQQGVSTSLLLPNGLFSAGYYSNPPTFLGEVTVTKSTTYYTLDCNAGAAASEFHPQYECNGNSYTFSEDPASTQYLVNTYLDFIGAGAASSSTNEGLQSWTINCDPLGTSSSATCTTTYTDVLAYSSVYSITDPTYFTNIESSFYSVIFTTAVGYSAASEIVTTSATPSPTSSAPTAKSTTKSTATSPTAATAHPTLSPSSKIGIGLGVPLGACAFAGVALLLYRHGKHKERSRMTQMENLAPPPGFASEPDGKRFSEAGMADQKAGRQPPVYSMEMQG